MTGTTWVEESGFIDGPVMITNTHSVGVVRDAYLQWLVNHKRTSGTNVYPDGFFTCRFNVIFLPSRRTAPTRLTVFTSPCSPPPAFSRSNRFLRPRACVARCPAPNRRMYSSCFLM